MSLTKVQPSGLDSTKDYAFDQLTANTVVAGGVDLYAFANAAFNKANTSPIYTISNTAPMGVNFGDLWYKQNEDIIFEYISDGVSNYWLQK